MRVIHSIMGLALTGGDHTLVIHCFLYSPEEIILILYCEVVIVIPDQIKDIPHCLELIGDKDILFPDPREESHTKESHIVFI